MNTTIFGQNVIEAPRCYDTQIGNMISMLEDLKECVTRIIYNLSQEETLQLLMTKDNTWFVKQVPNGCINNHKAWYHVVKHKANYIGQIVMWVKRSRS